MRLSRLAFEYSYSMESTHASDQVQPKPPGLRCSIGSVDVDVRRRGHVEKVDIIIRQHHLDAARDGRDVDVDAARCPDCI